MAQMSSSKLSVGFGAMAWRRAGLDGATGTAAVAAIGAYQRYVSPHKGFGCAWRAHTGGPSCSAWGRRVMGRFGWVMGWALLMRQFRRCQQAAAALRGQSLAMAETPRAVPGGPGAPGAPGASGEGEQTEKPNDPVVNEACPLWSKRIDGWCWSGRATTSAQCCASLFPF